MPINQFASQLPPSQMVSYQQLMPMQTHAVQSQASSPAFGMQHGMPPATVQTTSRVQTMSRAPTTDRESSESRLLPLPSSDLTGRSPSEQASCAASCR